MQNENNTDISFYSIYLPKLHENILKYYRLNSSQEITIYFNCSLQSTLDSSASFLDSLPI